MSSAGGGFRQIMGALNAVDRQIHQDSPVEGMQAA